MKTVLKYSVLSFSILLLSFASVNEVVTAIKNGNAAQLAKFFDNTVDITLPAKNNTYSKSQAELVLKDFFSINSVKDFSLERKDEKSTNPFLTGILITKNGNFRTTVYMKQRGDKQLLQEIRFEK